MRYSALALMVMAALLSGCGSSSRPVYSGHEESTEGVPGFVNGKKVSPHVKLGQSYSVDGETYVPKNQPDYVEEGMASWYGPGFHGGKTANGEKFDANGLTAAHRTLPLPSIVRVTMLSTGKQAYVRINDRGPFARSRIIDLSRGAAEKIGLLRAGVAKVRVEYMPKESQRFAELLGQGRDPNSIDVASEVLNYNPSGDQPTQYARGDVRVTSPDPEPAKSSSDRWSPVASAQAAEPGATVAEEETEEVAADEDAPTGNAIAAPVAGVASSDLPVANVAPAAGKKSNKDEDSPFAAMDQATTAPPPRETQLAAVEPGMPPKSAQPPADVGAEKYYVQLGAFLKMENANKLIKQYGGMGPTEVVQKPNAKGQMLYHVRVGPYASAAAGSSTLAKLQNAGADARMIHE